MVTRQQVAHHAGVSPAVVSYVLNGGPRPVAKATQERVLAAVRELEYTPNAVARSLRMSRTRAFGLVVPDVVNAFFAQLAREIEAAAFRDDMTLLLGNAMDDPEREHAYVQTFIERRVEGMILAPTGRNVEAGRTLLKSRMPVVIIDRELPHSLGSTVLVDNAYGGYLATQHLIEHGHRNIALLAGPPYVASAKERRRGWMRAMHQAGFSTDGLSFELPFERQAARDVTTHLLNQTPRPTAMFISSDEQSFGVYRAVADAGMRVPDDLALASFDSSDAAPYFVPSLTAVHQPTSKMAERALEVLLAQTSDPDRVPTRDTFPVDLVVRESCGCSGPPPATKP